VSRSAVVVFHMPGCEACAEYVPRFQRVASQRARVPVYILDANAPQNQALADRLNVTAVPCTFVLRQPHGVMRREGGLSDEEIVWVLAVAAHYK
jgi:thiol-disulfide isomerase/thioredoxin